MYTNVYIPKWHCIHAKWHYLTMTIYCIYISVHIFNIHSVWGFSQPVDALVYWQGVNRPPRRYSRRMSWLQTSVNSSIVLKLNHKRVYQASSTCINQWTKSFCKWHTLTSSLNHTQGRSIIDARGINRDIIPVPGCTCKEIDFIIYSWF